MHQNLILALKELDASLSFGGWEGAFPQADRACSRLRISSLMLFAGGSRLRTVLKISQIDQTDIISFKLAQSLVD